MMGWESLLKHLRVLQPMLLSRQPGLVLVGSEMAGRGVLR